jgi:anti-sigma factor RsiW
MSVSTVNMDCEDVRAHLPARRRGTLEPTLRAAVDAHLETCSACRQEDAADAQLEVQLRTELPAARAPASLLARLAATMEPPRSAAIVPLAVPAPAPAPPVPPPRPRWRRRLGAAAPALAVAATLLLAIPAYYELQVLPDRLARAEAARLGAEAVNDHLRLLSGEQPLAIVSSGLHEVKPWFAGKLDFAPVVSFTGGDAFPLQGGAVATFLDRKAAALVYRRRLHTITLFVVRADGLPWPAPRLSARSVRGFNLLLWRSGELGYALVSDVDASELRDLAQKLGAPAR